MRHIWSSEGRAALAQLAQSRPLLAFDFDGTIAPIVDRPDDAYTSPPIAQLLAALCAYFPVAIVTGRSVDDVKPRLRFAPHYVAGNHGAEGLGAPQAGIATSRLQEWAQACHQELAKVGVQIEDKGLSLALHYRLAPDPLAAQAEIERFLPRLPEEYVFFGGKRVVNIVARAAPNKGDAVAAILQACSADGVLYVGDDVNDEAVFERAEEGWLTVRVEPAFGRSRAGFYVNSLQDLQWLLEDLLRGAQAGPGQALPAT